MDEKELQEILGKHKLWIDPKILIVDDDVTIRNLMKEFIETVGYEICTASDAEEALALFKTNSFEIVITDIMTPGMDGLELTELLKKNHDTEVIIITGYSGDYTYQDAIDKGASDFVFKPARFEELLLRIKRVLKERWMRKDGNIFTSSEKGENVIIRSIEFPPEYHHAGISILNYFGTVLRKKYPETKAKIRIEQDGLKVTMIIDPLEGEREIIEKALDEYFLTSWQPG